MITSPSLWVIPSILSGICTLKHEIGKPLSVPMFAQMGELRLIHPLSIISLKESFNSGLYNFWHAAAQMRSIAPSTVSPFNRYPLFRICSLSSFFHHNFSCSYFPAISDNVLAGGATVSNKFVMQQVFCC